MSLVLIDFNPKTNMPKSTQTSVSGPKDSKSQRGHPKTKVARSWHKIQSMSAKESVVTSGEPLERWLTQDSRDDPWNPLDAGFWPIESSHHTGDETGSNEAVDGSHQVL